MYFYIYTYSPKQKASTCWIVLSFLLREITSSFSRINFLQSSHSSLISVFCLQRTIMKLHFVLCWLFLIYINLFPNNLLYLCIFKKKNKRIVLFNCFNAFSIQIFGVKQVRAGYCSRVTFLLNLALGIWK